MKSKPLNALQDLLREFNGEAYQYGRNAKVGSLRGATLRSNPTKRKLSTCWDTLCSLYLLS